MSAKMIGLGIMSGSSLDAIDAVVVEISKDQFTFIEKATIPFPRALKDGLRQAANLPLRDYLILESEYSTFLAYSILSNFKSDYDFISVHGHTTHHFPSEVISNQMINGGILSALTKKKVVTDFRIGDIALGGKGTPMVTIAEKYLFKGYDYYLNLGGIANISIAHDWSAYDISPCNQLLNYLAYKINLDYDAEGKVACGGTMIPELFETLGRFDYYQELPPKSIDNNWIKENYFPLLDSVDVIPDALFTTVKWIATQIDQSISISQPGNLFVTGGGTHNSFLIEEIRTLLLKKNISIVIPEQDIVDYKEAILMAYLGYLRISNQPNLLHSVTGASRNSLGGAIYNVHGS